MTTKIDYRMPSKMLTTCERQTKTSRSLFGKPDAHETERLYNEEMARNRARMMNRYSFDIITEKLSSHSLYSSPKAYSLQRSGHPFTERLKDMGNMPVNLQTNIAKMCNDRRSLKNASPMSKNKPFGPTDMHRQRKTTKLPKTDSTTPKSDSTAKQDMAKRQRDGH